MSTLAVDKTVCPARATGLAIGEDGFAVSLSDGRRLMVPYRCYPRLKKATARQRAHFEVYAEGRMLRWPDVDEDIEVLHVIQGRMPLKLGREIVAVPEPGATYTVRKRRISSRERKRSG